MGLPTNKSLSIFFLLTILIFLFFFFKLGNYDLAAPDEPRFALVAREMLFNNHWILPHRNDNPYPDKPPLFFWLIAGFSALAGGAVTAWTARLPSAIAATFILLFMWFWSKKDQEDSLRPLLTTLILMSSVLFFYQARMAQLDMLLCFLTTVSLILGFKALTGEQYSIVGLGICLGMAILAKGPVGYLIPVGSMALFAVFEGKKAWRAFPWKSLLWGFVPVVIWIVLLAIEVTLKNQWAYLHNLLFKQTLVRYFNPWHHYKPFYYFFTTLLYDFFPWILFLLAAIPLTKTKRAALNDQQKFAWAVFLFTLVFFSLSKGKRNLYLLPLFPFAAYLVATHIEALFKEYVVSWREKLPWIICAILFFTGGVAILLFAGGYIKAPADILSKKPSLQIGISGLLLITASFFIFNQSVKKRMPQAFIGIVTAMLIFTLLTYLVIFPWLNPFRSARYFMAEANKIIHDQSQNPVVGMVDYRSEYRFYGDFPLRELTRKNDIAPGSYLMNLEDFFQEYPKGWCIIKEKDFRDFSKKHPDSLHIHIKKNVGERKILLINQKDQPLEGPGAESPTTLNPSSVF